MPARSGWFAGDEAVDERNRRFVAAVAGAAAGWDLSDLTPEGTASYLSSEGDDDHGAPDEALGEEVVVAVRVPGLTTERRHVRVRYDPDVEGLPTLSSEWTRRAEGFGDRWGYDGCDAPEEDTDLVVHGVAATPEQCGAWAAAWLLRQLRRPVRRREWDVPTSGWATLVPRRRPGTPALVEWTIGAPDGYLDLRGEIPWDWLRRREPDREVWERGRASDATRT